MNKLIEKSLRGNLKFKPKCNLKVKNTGFVF